MKCQVYQLVAEWPSPRDYEEWKDIFERISRQSFSCYVKRYYFQMQPAIVAEFEARGDRGHAAFLAREAGATVTEREFMRHVDEVVPPQRGPAE